MDFNFVGGALFGATVRTLLMRLWMPFIKPGSGRQRRRPTYDVTDAPGRRVTNRFIVNKAAEQTSLRRVREHASLMPRPVSRVTSSARRVRWRHLASFSAAADDDDDDANDSDVG